VAIKGAGGVRRVRNPIAAASRITWIYGYDLTPKVVKNFVCSFRDVKVVLQILDAIFANIRASFLPLGFNRLGMDTVISWIQEVVGVVDYKVMIKKNRCA
jgi:hypothetical protein